MARNGFSFYFTYVSDEKHTRGNNMVTKHAASWIGFIKLFYKKHKKLLCYHQLPFKHRNYRETVSGAHFTNDFPSVLNQVVVMWSLWNLLYAATAVLGTLQWSYIETNFPSNLIYCKLVLNNCWVVKNLLCCISRGLNKYQHWHRDMYVYIWLSDLGRTQPHLSFDR